VTQVLVNASYRTTWVHVYGGTKDPHSTMVRGHSTLDTVVLGEGMSKYQIPPTSATIAACLQVNSREVQLCSSWLAQVDFRKGGRFTAEGVDSCIKNQTALFSTYLSSAITLNMCSRHLYMGSAFALRSGIRARLYFDSIANCFVADC
jgi:hypothetical protein